MTYDPASRTVRELLADWASIMRQLRERDVIRTNNNPIGDIAEAIVHLHYGGDRASFSHPAWDVRTEDGERIQVKAMRQTPNNKRTALSPIRDSEYDTVVVVIFDEDFRVTESLRIDRATVEATFKHSAHVNGRIIRITKKLRADPDVLRVDLSDAMLDS